MNTIWVVEVSEDGENWLPDICGNIYGEPLTEADALEILEDVKNLGQYRATPYAPVER